MFLYYGWFRRVESQAGIYRYAQDAPDLHVIFGWLQIEQRIPSSQWSRLPAWAGDHAHCRRAQPLALDSLYILWFTDRAGLIVKMTPAGKFTTFKVPRSNGATDDIAAGPDGNLWFTLGSTDTSSKIGRITPAGVITEFSFPSPLSSDYLYLGGIAAGPDGNLWFTYDNLTTNVTAIGRVTTGGAITLTPTLTANSLPTDITAGPDGAMWFTEAAQNVGRITTG